MNSSLTGVSDGPDELSNILYPAVLFLSMPNVFWTEMFAIAQAFHSLGSDAVWGLLAEIYAHGGMVDVRRDVADVTNEIEGDFGHAFGLVLAAVALPLTPILTALGHMLLMVWPSSPFNKQYGLAKLGALQYSNKPTDGPNALAGYAALYEQSADEKAAISSARQQR